MCKTGSGEPQAKLTIALSGMAPCILCGRRGITALMQHAGVDDGDGWICDHCARPPDSVAPVTGNAEAVRELLGEQPPSLPERLRAAARWIDNPPMRATPLLREAADAIERLRPLAARCEAHQGDVAEGRCVCCEAVEVKRLEAVVAKLRRPRYLPVPCPQCQLGFVYYDPVYGDAACDKCHERWAKAAEAAKEKSDESA